MIKVSVIIPAYNAENTIARTLESVLAQTYSDWEAIVIDDGSEDKTAAKTTVFAEKDNRIRVVSQKNQGVSAARNTGIRMSKHEWLLFLDADDWISDHYLERMNDVLTSHTGIDAVHCGWVRVANDGNFLEEKHAPDLEDLFPILASHCPFAIHSLIVRKAVIVSVGNFDASLITCEEWDLWQRIARTGAKFKAIKGVMAFYQMRPESLSKNIIQLFKDGIQVIVQGHSPDTRVSIPKQEHKRGEPSAYLHGCKLQFTCWIAGHLFGLGKDAQHLLKIVDEAHDLFLDPKQVAHGIFESTLISKSETLDYWFKIWSDVEKKIWNFLLALEAQSMAPNLAKRTMLILERIILEYTKITIPIKVGNFYALKIEVTKEIVDIYPPSLTERLFCIVEMEGVELGKIELPISDGFVSAWVLKDTIAAKYAWQILGRFFEHTIYKKSDTSEIELQSSSLASLHDKVGWEIFMQQLWNRPGWPLDRFYDVSFNDESVTHVLNAEELFGIEITDEISNIKFNGYTHDHLILVGGIEIGKINLQAEGYFVSAHYLRATINIMYGFELCCICVREGLLGYPLNELISLRERLTRLSFIQMSHLKSTNAIELQHLSASSLITPKALVLGRRSGPIGGSASRRSILPSKAASELYKMANTVNEPILQVPEGKLMDRVLYVPESDSKQVIITSTTSNQHQKIKETSVFGRQHFETLFSKHADPWKYTHPYEQTKYELTLSLIPDKQINTALEIACAEGHFTEQLAPKVKSLVAVDISQIALNRSDERCQHLNNVHFQHIDLIKDKLPGKFDLIVCSEVLYFVGELEELKAVARKFVDGLNPNGYLLMAHAHQVVDEPDKPGFDWGLSFGAKVIGDTFASISSLYLKKEIRTPLYRIQLFQRKENKLFSWFEKKNIDLKLVDQPTPVPPSVESSVRWNGGQPSFVIDQKSVITKSLPILMYHRVAPAGATALSRYRVTPKQFEDQLKYLRDSGYYSVDWRAWQQAILTRKALPGRAIALTFDDGYLDFYQYAWPLLNKYGFTATVFLVANHIGQTNSWDKVYGEEIPLMGLEEIQQLKRQGVVFGSHSYSHAPLTALIPEEIVREGAKSRTILHQVMNSALQLFAYPYGDTDAAVAHLIGACGYDLGFTCRPGLATFRDDMLLIPRIEVCGSDSLQDFIAKID